MPSPVAASPASTGASLNAAPANSPPSSVAATGATGATGGITGAAGGNTVPAASLAPAVPAGATVPAVPAGVEVKPTFGFIASAFGENAGFMTVVVAPVR